jgi:prophage antirepressor-like protein
MKLLDFTNDTIGTHIRMCIIDDQPYAIGADLCRALGIENHKQALGRLTPNERWEGVQCTPSIRGKKGGGIQPMTAVNEPGMYRLILTSRAPKAEAFKTWLCHEVLPALRKYGFYSMFPDSEDAARQKLAGRVAGQMTRIRESVENLAEQKIPDGYGSIMQHLAGMGVEVGNGDRLRIASAARVVAQEQRVSVVPVWHAKSWRAVSYYPRSVITEALRLALPAEKPHPELFPTDSEAN